LETLPNVAAQSPAKSQPAHHDLQLLPSDMES
jgi:hypothetical protein